MNSKHKQVSITLTPENHVLLKRHSYGNVSRLIELMISAYDQGRMLTEEEVIEGRLNSIGEIKVKTAA